MRLNRRGWAMLTIAVLVLGACGGDDDGSDSAEPESTTTVATVSPQREYLDSLAVTTLTMHLTDAYARSIPDGRNASVASNYLVWDRTHSPQQCLEAIPRRLGFLAGVSVTLKPAIDTLTFVPTQRTEALEDKPKGRLYQVGLDVTFNSPAAGTTYGPVRVTKDVVVVEDNTAKFISSCD